jgi:hypothetical protein
MFQRGSKIIIIESSSSGRAHPAVGDIGYLNNMYLFFVDRFILLDAFFFAYKSDRKGRNDRCERKRFIIDLGMTRSLKHRLQIYGVPKKFFTRNKHVTNLSPAAYNIGGGVLTESPNINSIWWRPNNRKLQTTLNNAVKIPYGQIALAPQRRKTIWSDGAGAVRCWIECMLPVFNAEIIFIQGNGSTAYISNMASDIYRRMLDSCTIIMPTVHGSSIALRKDAIVRFKLLSINESIDGVRKVHSLSKYLLDNCDANFLADRSKSMYMSMFSQKWGRDGLKSACDNNFPPQSIPEQIIKFVTGFFFRSIIMSGNTENNLYLLQEAGGLQWKLDKVREVSKELEDMKRAADFNSAALNRIFERDLLG